ncbi:tyrosine-type recombinase/integrase [Nocardia transvalensis]|uniref:tyrosine-type recombinase/integrase n=1 Tax=Nocardia transvalensis TaxID=37333 RepID=UPI001C3F3795
MLPAPGPHYPITNSHRSTTPHPPPATTPSWTPSSCGLHIETACRTRGALALRPEDPDPENYLIWLREKDQSDHWQPISPTLMRALIAHSDRGNDPHGQLLRYRNGRPITRSRYSHLWQRIGRHHPWVATLGVTAHWLRHTTLKWVERNLGYAVARAYAGHAEPTGHDGPPSPTCAPPYPK